MYSAVDFWPDTLDFGRMHSIWPDTLYFGCIHSSRVYLASPESPCRLHSIEKNTTKYKTDETIYIFYGSIPGVFSEIYYLVVSPGFFIEISCNGAAILYLCRLGRLHSHQTVVKHRDIVTFCRIHSVAVYTRFVAGYTRYVAGYTL